MNTRSKACRRSVAAWLAVAALVAGCGRGATEAPTPAATKDATQTAETTAPAAPATAALALPADATTIGEAITVSSSPVKLADVRANPTAFFEKTILVEATAAASCQAKGCWMTITDGTGEPIWVRWSSGCGGQYAFPKDIAGKRVYVQGSFYPKEITPADAEHIAQESGSMKAEDIAGKAFEMNVTTCVVLPASVSAPSGTETAPQTS